MLTYYLSIVVNYLEGDWYIQTPRITFIAMKTDRHPYYEDR